MIVSQIPLKSSSEAINMNTIQIPFLANSKVQELRSNTSIDEQYANSFLANGKVPEFLSCHPNVLAAACRAVKLPGVPAEKPSKTSGSAKPSVAKEAEPAENFEKAHFQVGFLIFPSVSPLSTQQFWLAHREFCSRISCVKCHVPDIQRRGKL